jgi:hypothetical protein
LFEIAKLHLGGSLADAKDCQARSRDKLLHQSLHIGRPSAVSIAEDARILACVDGDRRKLAVVRVASKLWDRSQVRRSTLLLPLRRWRRQQLKGSDAASYLRA